VVDGIEAAGFRGWPQRWRCWRSWWFLCAVGTGPSPTAARPCSPSMQTGPARGRARGG